MNKIDKINKKVRGTFKQCINILKNVPHQEKLVSELKSKVNN